MATNWQIGDKIQGRWEIRKILSGNINMVYIVYNHELNKYFVVKTLRDEIFACSPTIAERFMQEAVTWVCLGLHANVVQAQMIQKIEDKPFLFVEYVGGGNLGDWIGTPRLIQKLHQILNFSIQFCNGMIHAISRGIRVHGNIKPQNCLITEDNTLKIADFGLLRVFDKVDKADWERMRADKKQAKQGGLLGQLFRRLQASGGDEVKISSVQDLRVALSRVGAGVETCAYMTPEQFDNPRHADVQTDIYSFGVMLFQMITGKLPFVGQTWQEFEQLHKTQPPPISDIPYPALSAIVETCLAKDPANRFADFHGIRERLIGIYEGLAKEPKPPVVAEVGPGEVSDATKGAALEDLKKEEEEAADLNLASTINLRTEHMGVSKGVELEVPGSIPIIRIHYTDQGVEEERVFYDEVIIGRKKEGLVPDLDLSFDRFVSRLQARIWVEGGVWWIEDLDSSNGTLINGEEIKGKEKRRLQAGDNIVYVGKTKLRVQVLDLYDLSSDDIQELSVPEAPIEIVEALDASVPIFAPIETTVTDVARWLTLLYELPLHCAAEMRLSALLKAIVDRMLGVIPKAKGGALMFKDPTTGKLVKAYLSDGEPVVDTRMAQQAIERQEAFIWLRNLQPGKPNESEIGVSASNIAQFHMESGMYAPLLWKGNPLGVVCVDNQKASSPFESSDLRLLVAVSHYAAMAIVNYKRQDDLQRNTALTRRLFTNFSPKVRGKFLEKARRGRLRLGGKKSEATILCSEIRGFMNLNASTSAGPALKLLNYYLSVLTEFIFKYDGTIVRFIDGMLLAVFGSPEPDTQQCEKALRAALEVQEAVKKLNTIWATRNQATCDMGIGIHSGELVSGFIGSDVWMEFTVMGDILDDALLYCDSAGAGEILISPEVYKEVYEIIQAEEVTIATKSEENLTAYRVKGMKV